MVLSCDEYGIQKIWNRSRVVSKFKLGIGLVEKGFQTSEKYSPREKNCEDLKNLQNFKNIYKI